MAQNSTAPMSMTRGSFRSQHEAGDLMRLPRKAPQKLIHHTRRNFQVDPLEAISKDPKVGLPTSPSRLFASCLNIFSKVHCNVILPTTFHSMSRDGPGPGRSRLALDKQATKTFPLATRAKCLARIHLSFLRGHHEAHWMEFKFENFRVLCALFYVPSGHSS